MIDGRPHMESKPLELSHENGARAEIYYFDTNRSLPRAIFMEDGRGNTFRATIEHSASPQDRAEMASVVALFQQRFEEVGWEAMDSLRDYFVYEPVLPSVTAAQISRADFDERVLERMKMVIPAEIDDEVYCILVDEVGALLQDGSVRLEDMRSFAERTVHNRPFVGEGEVSALHYADFTEELSRIARELFDLPESFFILDS